MTMWQCALIAALAILVLPFIVALYFRLFMRGITHAVIEIIKAIKQTNLKG
jgi:hypothetical protein